MKNDPTQNKEGKDKPSREEVFAKLNASAERTLRALEQAYEAGKKEGISDEEQDQLIEALRRAKNLRDEIRQMTEETPRDKKDSD